MTTVVPFTRAKFATQSPPLAPLDLPATLWNSHSGTRLFTGTYAEAYKAAGIHVPDEQSSAESVTRLFPVPFGLRSRFSLLFMQPPQSTEGRLAAYDPHKFAATHPMHVLSALIDGSCFTGLDEVNFVAQQTARGSCEDLYFVLQISCGKRTVHVLNEGGLKRLWNVWDALLVR